MLLLTAAPIAASLPLQTVSEIVAQLGQRPRAISGEIASRSRNVSNSQLPGAQQFSAVTVAFLPPREVPEELRPLAPKAMQVQVATLPPNKKQKTDAGKVETNSLRLRHLL